MERNHISFPEQGLPVAEGKVFCFHSRVRSPCVHQDLHAKSPGDGGDFFPDGAVADDPQSLSGQFDLRVVPENEVLAPGPLALCDGSCVVRHPIGDIQEVGKDVLGHCIRTVSGDVGDRYAFFFRVSHIYDIVAGGQDTDPF